MKPRTRHLPWAQRFTANQSRSRWHRTQRRARSRKHRAGNGQVQPWKRPRNTIYWPKTWSKSQMPALSHEKKDSHTGKVKTPWQGVQTHTANIKEKLILKKLTKMTATTPPHAKGLELETLAETNMTFPLETSEGSLFVAVSRKNWIQSKWEMEHQSTKGLAGNQRSL